MRCIFCKADSNSSISVEHVLPESFGNEQHILPHGWVCDDCNAYFSVKVEQPFMESGFGRSSRHFMRVPSKKGRIPSTFGLHPQSRTKVELFVHEDDTCSFCAADGEDETRFVQVLQSRPTGSLYVPDPGLPEADHITARFIAKVALEILALKCASITGWNNEVVGNVGLNELRRYARYGRPGFIWPIAIRQLHRRDFLFPADSESTANEVLHEWTILGIGEREAPEFYAIIAIFGVEFAINLGGPDLDGWRMWLKEHAGGSPLYPEGLPHIWTSE